MGWPVTKFAACKIAAKIFKSPYFYGGTGVVALVGTAKYRHDTDKDVIRLKACEAGEKECFAAYRACEETPEECDAELRTCLQPFQDCYNWYCHTLTYILGN